jgi:hypothetical protein
MGDAAKASQIAYETYRTLESNGLPARTIAAYKYVAAVTADVLHDGGESRREAGRLADVAARGNMPFGVGWLDKDPGAERA